VARSARSSAPKPANWSRCCFRTRFPQRFLRPPPALTHFVPATLRPAVVPTSTPSLSSARLRSVRPSTTARATLASTACAASTWPCNALITSSHSRVWEQFLSQPRLFPCGMQLGQRADSRGRFTSAGSTASVAWPPLSSPPVSAPSTPTPPANSAPPSTLLSTQSRANAAHPSPASSAETMQGQRFSAP
jgi:hypothetical protein